MLYNFLAWVLTGVNDDTKITLEEKVNVGNEEVHRHVMSIAQDIVHAGSHGRIRTPKHFILPMTVHHFTRKRAARFNVKPIGPWLLFFTH